MIIKTSEKKQIVDITDKVNDTLQEMHMIQGLCNLHVLHTTTALSVADLDPGTDHDLLDAFEAMAPKLKYRHPHDPSHVGDHIMSSLIGTNITLPVRDGKLVLGKWQNVILIELNGPREREIALTTINNN